MLISRGPTREPLDPVRFLSNYSTGYLGARLAAEALRRGHRVTVVSGPAHEPLPQGAREILVETSRQMERALRRHLGGADTLIMAAAVSDFRPARVTPLKWPRRNRRRLLLEAAPDILARLPRRRGQVIAGFVLESSRVVRRARRKLLAKRLDCVLAQGVRAGRRGDRVGGARAPFGRQPVRAWLLARDGSAKALGTISKAAVARALLDKIESLWYGQAVQEGRRGPQGA